MKLAALQDLDGSCRKIGVLPLQIRFVSFQASVRLLVQNAAIGDPAAVAELDLKHFEELCRAGALCSVE